MFGRKKTRVVTPKPGKDYHACNAHRTIAITSVLVKGSSLRFEPRD